jgi:hypothetical protein
MLMIDRYGRRVEVIRLDRCDGRGPREWIRVSWRGVLLGPGTPGLGQGYYRSPDAALAHVDAESLVEIVQLRK